MTTRAHLRLFLLGTLAWVVFWLGGLPDYYQQYSAAFMAGFDGLLTLALAAVLPRLLRRVRRERRLGTSLWMAFYFTGPLAFYDWLYCGLFLGDGIGFLLRYWYVSIYYIVPWLLLPACAVALDRHDRRTRSTPSR